MTRPPDLPRNFVDEVEIELAAARRQLAAQARRVAVLEELHVIARRVSFELGRPVTVFDVVRRSADSREREHRWGLIQALRGG